jgi:hypothetical protein
MRVSSLASLALAGGLSLAGCGSSEPGNAVDPAYLQAMEDMAKATCDCIGKPDAPVCGPKAFAIKPKAPSGGDPAAYEKTLKESDQKKLNVARGKSLQCILTITRDAKAAGAAPSGPLTSPATGTAAPDSPATASPSGSTP